MKNDINVPTIDVDLDELANDFTEWYATLNLKNDNDMYNLMKIFHTIFEPNTEKSLDEKHLISFKKFIIKETQNINNSSISRKELEDIVIDLTGKIKASQNKNDLTYLILLFLFEFDMNLVSNIVKMLNLYKIP